MIVKNHKGGYAILMDSDEFHDFENMLVVFAAGSNDPSLFTEINSAKKMIDDITAFDKEKDEQLARVEGSDGEVV